MAHDFDRIMEVGKLPRDVRQACVERGMTLDSRTTLQTAMREWSAWHLGDDYWGGKAWHLLAEMTATPDTKEG